MIASSARSSAASFQLRYIADFASIEARLIVEVDGASHDVPDQVDYDGERDAALNALGWRVLRVRDALVLSEPGKAADFIRKALL